FSVNATICRIDAESSTASIECISNSLAYPGRYLKEIYRTGIHFRLPNRLRMLRQIPIGCIAIQGPKTDFQCRQSPLGMAGKLRRHVLELQCSHRRPDRRLDALALLEVAAGLLLQPGEFVKATKQAARGVVDQCLQALQVGLDRR